MLIGEASHGTSEFYRMRARITKELIRTRGFGIVAVEADWPDARRIDRYVQALPDGHRSEEAAFARFPTWMWRNHETWGFVEWLRVFNAETRDPARHASFYGLDLYSLFTSIRAVLEYLERVDPAAARLARERYGCLTPWEGDPQAYGRAALSGRYRVCEKEAVAMLRDMLSRELDYAQRDGERFLDAVQNARLVADAERYYRAMYYGASESWNQRDRHMFDTLERLLAFHGPSSKAVVWAHNSHLGDARATEMSARGELNLGQLCRQRFGDAAFLVGFGTDHGTVAAAHDWDGPMRIMNLRPAHPESYERLCHDSGVRAFLLHLREPSREEVRDGAGAIAARARRRRHLPAGHRAPEPLLPRLAAVPVRRVHLVRRDAGGAAHHDRRDGDAPGAPPVQLRSSLKPLPDAGTRSTGRAPSWGERTGPRPL